MDGQRNSVVLPDQTAQLEAEQARMEERLKMLKRVMSVEKTQRGSNSSTASHWKSASKRGPLAKPAQSSAVSVNDGRKPLKVKLLTSDNTKSGQSVSHTLCGQCSLYRASMVCVECVEHYCTACFTKIHQKGALIKHHIRPLSTRTVREKKSKHKMTTSDSSGQCAQLKEKRDAHHTSTTDAEDPHVSEREGGLLLEGSYDEAASAAAFQQALAEWRKGGKGSNGSDELNTNRQQQHVPIETVSSSSCGVQAYSSDESQASIPVTVTFTTSCPPSSYLEQLLLKKLKKNKSLPLLSERAVVNKTPVISRGEDDLVTDCSSAPSIYNVFYSSEEDVTTQEQELFDVVETRSQEKVDGSSLSMSCDEDSSLGTMDDHERCESLHSSHQHSEELDNGEEQLTTSAIDTAVMLAWEESNTLWLPTNLTPVFVDITTEESSTNNAHNSEDSVSEQRLTLGGALWHPDHSVAVDKPSDTNLSDFSHSVPSHACAPSSILPGEIEIETVNTTTSSLKEEDENWEGEEDNRAIDELEWELASTIDGGRETRAALLEEEEEEVEKGDEGENELWSHVSAQQLMEDFEQYQETIKEQDDVPPS